MNGSGATERVLGPVTLLWVGGVRPEAPTDAAWLDAVTSAGGRLLTARYEGPVAAFAEAGAAVAAAATIQRRFADERARPSLAVHAAQAVSIAGRYCGGGAERGARVVEVANAGQILVTEAAAGNIALPMDLQLVDLGTYRLRDLGESIRLHQLTGPGLDAEFPPLRDLDDVTHNLPRLRTSFVGREVERQAVRTALRDSPLVTLTGVGGVGKSRLALQAAADALDEFGDGIRVVQLASTDDPANVAGAILHALGPAPPDRAGTDLLSELVARIGDRRLLILLDNAEHLRAECARVTDTLLERCGRLAMLVTSREPLGTSGERVIALSPLAVHVSERAGSDAVALFLDRASVATRALTLDDANWRAIGEICARVDGIPLAIELAAARVAHLAPTEIAARLDDRLLLRSRSTTTPERHRTIEAMLDWSHDLLTSAEQRLFRRLGVFAGSVRLETIEAVCGDESAAGPLFETLASLVDKSLVLMEPGPAGQRFRLLDTVRRYAAARLERVGETDRLRRARAVWFADTLETAAADLDASRIERMLRAEFDEAGAALHSALGAGHIDLACRLAGVLWRHWERTGRLQEGRRVLDELVREPRAATHAAYPAVLDGAASLSLAVGDLDAARSLYGANLDWHEARSDRRGVARSLNGLALVALFGRQLVEATDLVGRSLEEWTALGDETGRAYALTTKGMIDAASGRTEPAQHAMLAALRRLREAGRRRDAASVLNNLGNLSRDCGELMRAHRFYEGALELYRHTGDDRGAALSLNNLSIISRERGDTDRAADFANDALSLFERMGDAHGAAAMLNNLANLADEQQDPRRALELYGKAIERFRRNGDGRSVATGLENLADVAARTYNGRLAWKALLEAASIHSRYARWAAAALDLTRASGLAAGLHLHHDALVLLGAAETLFAREQDRFTTAAAVIAAMRGPLDDEATDEALAEGRRADAQELIARLLLLPLPDVKPPPQPERRSILTRREREVVIRVARGSSNREIAAELFISERTVESHITNIRNKLGITSRTEMAVWGDRELRGNSAN